MKLRLYALLGVWCCALPMAVLAGPTGAGAVQYELGRSYRNGAGVPPDRERALAHMTAAAHQGSAAAMFALSNMLSEGAKPDAASARRWLERAAELEHPEALQQMALHIQDGTLGYARDEVRAAQLMRVAAHALTHRSSHDR